MVVSIARKIGGFLVINVQAEAVDALTEFAVTCTRRLLTILDVIARINRADDLISYELKDVNAMNELASLFQNVTIGRNSSTDIDNSNILEIMKGGAETTMASEYYGIASSAYSVEGNTDISVTDIVTADTARPSLDATFVPMSGGGEGGGGEGGGGGGDEEVLPRKAFSYILNMAMKHPSQSQVVEAIAPRSSTVVEKSLKPLKDNHVKEGLRKIVEFNIQNLIQCILSHYKKTTMNNNNNNNNTNRANNASLLLTSELVKKAEMVGPSFTIPV
jgi:hypothetical protein